MTNTAARSCRLITLGCKVNQYETQHVKEALEQHGWREAAADERADLCLVNTCTVTHEADAKARQLIRRLAHINPGAQIAVMGCFATRDPVTVARLPGVTHVIMDKNRLSQELQRYGVRAMPRGIARFDGHQRAFVKVQDGCLLNCSYCIIPHVRPQLRSRPVELIEAEVAALVERGCREIVLTGIHLGHYGIDLSRGRPKSQWQRLWHLLRRLCRLGGDFRIRLSSLEAAEVRSDLLEVMAAEPRVCPHLHICLQSGSDKILHAMKRRYTKRGFLERCRDIRSIMDQPALTTDVIVGFPGETDADFEETCAVLREGGFCKAHFFSFSPRAGTSAALLRNRVPPQVVEERRARLLALEAQCRDTYARTLIGWELDVLVEASTPRNAGHVRGTSCRHLPVELPGLADALLGRRVLVRPHRLSHGTLLADPAPGESLAATMTPDNEQRAGLRVQLPVLAAN
jgi:threonylcarbamoyladenosine tRNA methylthiotransferase MtaB